MQQNWIQIKSNVWSGKQAMRSSLQMQLMRCWWLNLALGPEFLESSGIFVLFLPPNSVLFHHLMTSHFWTQRTWSYFTSHTSLKATTALSTWGIRRAGFGPVELSRARQVPPVHLDRVSASLGKWSSHSRGSGLGKLTTFHPSRSCASPTADTLPYILSTFLPTLHLQCQRRKIIGNF